MDVDSEPRIGVGGAGARAARDLVPNHRSLYASGTDEKLEEAALFRAES
jgi:hypothetical protein